MTFTDWGQTEPNEYYPGEDFGVLQFETPFLRWNDWGPGSADYHPVRGIIELSTREDNDDDGIHDDIERSGPKGPDGNSDGIPDSEQGNCATFPNVVDGTYVTICAPSGTALKDVKSLANPLRDESPEGVDFPVGFFQ